MEKTKGMIGKTVIITGANSGIGKQTALELARSGARIVLAGRESPKSQAAHEELLAAAPGAQLELRALDLSSFESIRNFTGGIARDIDRIDVLLNNAGTMPKRLQLTADGFEAQIGINHLGHYLLTRLLLPKLQAGHEARIIHVSSMLHTRGDIDFENFRGQKGYKTFDAYYQSKLANVLFSNELARRLEGSQVTSNALHPGGIQTDIMRDNNFLIRWITRLMFKPVTEGAKTSVMLASDPELAGVSGRYFDQCEEKPPGGKALDPELADRLWKHSAELVGMD
ncbi:SDR family oxidoreductase [Myxococcota bacterium]|nr:SDR family oxidoreductase [Myxococcota bacterium]